MVDERLVTKRPLKLHPEWSDLNDNIASFDWTAVCSCHTIATENRQ
jgi:hypothetical protein